MIEEPESPREPNSDPREKEPEDCPELIEHPASSGSRNGSRVPKKQLSAKSDVETKLEENGLRLRDSELDAINESSREERRGSNGSLLMNENNDKKSPLLKVDGVDDTPA